MPKIFGKTMFTDEGGLAISMTNVSSGATTKGYLVTPSSSANYTARVLEAGEPDCIGVFYETGTSQGGEAWVVVSGMADVYFDAAVTTSYWASSATSDSGIARATTAPTPPFESDQHWREIGHVCQTTTAAGLARTVLHFN